MYWYLSFLRPPPVSVPKTANSVQITPQITNDLRTELKYDPVDIGYIWQRVSPTPYDTRVELLTTWELPGSTYRAMSVPLPSARVGETWRLGLVVLNSDGSSTPSLISFCRPDPAIVPVWSGPILITGPASNPSSIGPIRGKASKAKRKEDENVAAKQDRIQREWMAGDSVMKIIEQTSFDLDKKIWDSGLALSSWFWSHLVENPSLPFEGEWMELVLRRLRGPQERRLRVLELGGGTGLVSIILHRIVHALQEGVEITTTDLETAIPLMEENIAVNASEGSRAIQARILDWDQPLPEWVHGEPDSLSWPDIIIAADVTYNTASFPSLLKTITALLLPAEISNHPSLILAYKERDPAERQLWDMLLTAGIRMEKVDEILGAEEEGRVEIWLGHADGMDEP